MSSSQPESVDRPIAGGKLPENRITPGDRLTQSRELSWLEEIAVQLENNPDECWQAMESLAQVEPEVRLSIIDELCALAPRPGAAKLLRLLSSTRDPVTCSAAQAALGRIDRPTSRLLELAATSSRAEAKSPFRSLQALGQDRPFLFFRVSKNRGRVWRGAWSLPSMEGVEQRSWFRSTTCISAAPRRFCVTSNAASATSWEKSSRSQMALEV
jgi:hypothetical protein